MKITTSIITGLFLFINSTFSQAPVIQWDADLGALDNEQLYSIKQTTDGGYIMGGYSESGISGDKTQASHGSSDYWIVKTDSDGVKLWDARFGGSSVDQLTDLQQTADGGYILGGTSFSGIGGDKTQASRGLSDFWIVKTDANGVMQWDARFGGDSLDELHSLQQTFDGGYILGGYSISILGGDQTHNRFGGKDFWILKTDSNGIKQWDSRFGGAQFEELNSVRQTTDNGFILGGYSLSGISGNKTKPSQGSYDYWIVKTDASGTMQWDAAFGGLDEDWLTQLQQTNDGGYILGGWSWSGITGDKSQPSQGDNDFWIVKTDGNGVKQWDADFGGSSNDYMGPIQQTIEGGYILAGYSSSPVSGSKTEPTQGGIDYWLVKTDSNGVKQWDADFGGSDFDFLHSIKQTTDGGYILGGYSDSGISGDKTQVNKGVNDYWVIKINNGGTTDINPISLNTDISISSYPNPFSSSTTLDLNLTEANNISFTMNIVDFAGREVMSIPVKNIQSGKNKITLDLSALESGIYFCKINSNKISQTIKLIKN